MDSIKNVNILIIENNSTEIKLIKEIIDTEEWKVNFNHVKDGIEAMNYLHQKGEYKDCLKPSLILLELNLPKKSGLEVLKEIKKDEILKCIPVIILTDSPDDMCMIESYEHHVNAYIVKPADCDKFKEDMLIFKDFWFNSVQLPTN
jgi:Response regulators consisting of a CheY-like receiver domain and a winged-helix DNA-binding domain